ncbi:NAD(P)H-dependent oxidoreductase [Fulvivirga sp. M361]|uniref:NADPH-dependent FMN reductase n=1 Tax=Fulvivirga sp. M361 TaxID=2594266 RepID=UPI00117B7361|nr:NAD(P)H-dependent oxidoreductase [Fulvivirga sp. M361]TRX54360.1 NAD(P)H-dependent oxidoreductase [Fulvivirga sp. M361]
MNDILIICGTNRKDSISKKIALIYQSLLEELGQSTQLIDLLELPNDFAFSALYENSGKNTQFNTYRTLMLEAQKFVFVVPEYNGSFPGVLKTFIDGLKFPGTFTDKKCALVGVSSGVQGAGLALSHLTDIFNYCGTYVLPVKPKLALIDDHFQNGVITNKLYLELLQIQAAKLIAF